MIVRAAFHLLVLTLLCFQTAIFAQDTVESSDPLVNRQTSVAQRFARLEELLLRLADVESRENPERAALLKRVAKQSRQKFVLEKLKGASTLIAKGQLSQALKDQKSATTELESLLKLLLTEDRSSRIRDEKKRIAEIIKQLRLTERNERSVRARTENGVDLEEVEKQQKAITERAEKLSKELQEQDENDEAKSSEESKSSDAESKSDDSSEESSEAEKPSDESESSEQESSKKPSSSEKPEDSQSPSESKPSDSEQSESEQAESSESESSEQKQSPSESESQPSQSSPQDSPPPSNQPPPTAEQLAQQQLKKAVEKMKQAQDKLAKKDRGGATQEQRQAEEELRKAIDKLEKILRQLREEEVQRELAKLESRLRKMAAMQSAVLDQTLQLAKTPKAQRNRATDLKSGDLAFEEQKITLEADRAMLLLREEGSSVAFPEVILQLREDTGRVATRLGQSKIDLVTQGIQNDILAALEEMIGALAKAQRDLEKKQQQQQQGGPSSQGSQEEPLVQALAELKLIRTMQTRIQSSTDRYADLLQSDNAEEQNVTGEDVLPLLQNLAQRQDRLYQITRDLVTKRNQ